MNFVEGRGWRCQLYQFILCNKISIHLLTNRVKGRRVGRWDGSSAHRRGDDENEKSVDKGATFNCDRVDRIDKSMAVVSLSVVAAAAAASR